MYDKTVVRMYLVDPEEKLISKTCFQATIMIIIKTYVEQQFLMIYQIFRYFFVNSLVKLHVKCLKGVRNKWLLVKRQAKERYPLTKG